jgi:hypothetical protein
MATGKRPQRTGTIYKYMPGSTAPDLTGDSAAVIPWVTDGYEAIEVFVDTALRDRVADICALVDGWAATHRTLDELSGAAMIWSDNEDVSASIYENPKDDPSVKTVAIAFTIG